MIDTSTRPACLRGRNHFHIPGPVNPVYEDGQEPGIQSPIQVHSGSYPVSANYGDELTVESTGSKSIIFDTYTMGEDLWFRAGYPITLVTSVEDTEMYAVVTSYDMETQTLVFDIFDSVGSGTYTGWVVYAPALKWPWNFVQNTNYSAFDTSMRLETGSFGEIGAELGSADLIWPEYIEEETVETSPTSGYVEVTYFLMAFVVESEYDIHRPYVGQTITSTQTLTTTFTATGSPPVITTEDFTKSHTFVEEDFDPDGTGYAPGLPVIYNLSGGIIQYPTAGTYATKLEGGTYKSYEYTEDTTTTRTWGPPTYSTPSPPDFFWPG